MHGNNRGTGNSFFAVIAAAGLLVAGSGANAAEIKILSSTSLIPAMNQIIPKFEKATGNKIVVDYQISAAAKKMMDEGTASPDLVMITSAAVDDLAKTGKVSAVGKEPISSAGVGIAVRAGAPKPDISTTDALKKTLLNAKSITYTDPATGGASGAYFGKLLERLGIAEQMKAKTKLGKGEPVGEYVAKGEIELAVQQVPELMGVKGVDLVGPLPAEVQNVSMTSAAVTTAAKQPAEAAAFIKYLSSPEATDIMTKAGLTPQ